MIEEKLLSMYGAGIERVGFVMPDGELVEVKNTAEDPSTNFAVSGFDIVKHAFSASATWHTHPDASSNLSEADVGAFRNFPDLTHYIVGKDGIASYRVENGEVLRNV